MSIITTWVGTYALRTPGVFSATNATVFLDEDTEVQPDALLFRVSPGDSPIRVTDEGYLDGAPQFVVEVAASSASYDLYDKKER